MLKSIHSTSRRVSFVRGILIFNFITFFGTRTHSTAEMSKTNVRGRRTSSSSCSGDDEVEVHIGDNQPPTTCEVSPGESDTSSSYKRCSTSVQIPNSGDYICPSSTTMTGGYQFTISHTQDTFDATLTNCWMPNPGLCTGWAVDLSICCEEGTTTTTTEIATTTTSSMTTTESATTTMTIPSSATTTVAVMDTTQATETNSDNINVYEGNSESFFDSSNSESSALLLCLFSLGLIVCSPALVVFMKGLCEPSEKYEV